MASEPIQDYITEHETRFLEELQALLRIPSISTKAEMTDEVRRCAEWLRDHLRTIGFDEVELHPTDGHPILFAEHKHAKDAPTVLIYGHYDVQPPEPLEEWHSPPFEPTIRDGKIYARGATDDKGQFFAHIKGLEAYLKTRGTLPLNVKLLIEGEEEIGSMHLEPWVRANRDRLACDAVIISDSSMFAPARPSITYGLRGLSYFEVVVRGPGHDLHSGLYGGGVPNPIHVLSQLICALHDDQGRITIPGFYDDVLVLEPDERKAFAALGQSDEAFQAEVGAPGLFGEAGYSTLERIWARPTLDVNGIWGGYIEAGAKTVLPSKASAKISCRLVPNQDPADIQKKAEAFLQSLVPSYSKLEFKPHHGGKPALISRSHPMVQAAMRSLEKTWNVEPVFTRGGGTIPVVATFEEALGVPSILMGFGLSDDRLHSPNEKMDLENYLQGIRASGYLFDELARVAA